MLKDRYDNAIDTASASARDHYIAAVDNLLAAGPGTTRGFEAAIAEDPGFALGHAGLARARHGAGDTAGARTAMQTARGLSDGLTAQQKGHIHALGLLIDGNVAEAYRVIRAHAIAHPRDALAVQPCCGVFGLIGFSGQPGREAELLAYTESLLPHYGEDWWMLNQHAFSLCETGQTARADAMIERSLAINPRNANGAHVRSHVYYEAGETAAGIAYLEDWLRGYDRSAVLHGHLSWHVALWSLEQGTPAEMWNRVDSDVVPEASHGLPINVLTDTASILYRAELAGQDVPAERWTEISAYAAKAFPATGNAFTDVHAALAHAMAGNGAAVEVIIDTAKGPAADMVRDLSEAYRAVARQDWAGADRHLTAGLADSARLGGSRAQRDLLEFTLLGVLMKQGRTEEARRLLALRRPALMGMHGVQGL